jgi:hypothetical protein
MDKSKAAPSAGRTIDIPDTREEDWPSPPPGDTTPSERPASATSVSVSEAREGPGPTPPETGRQVPLSTEGSPLVPGSTRTGGGETPSPNSGAPDSNIAREDGTGQS